MRVFESIIIGEVVADFLFALKEAAIASIRKPVEVVEVHQIGIRGDLADGEFLALRMHQMNVGVDIPKRRPVAKDTVHVADIGIKKGHAG